MYNVIAYSHFNAVLAPELCSSYSLTCEASKENVFIGYAALSYTCASAVCPEATLALINAGVPYSPLETSRREPFGELPGRH